MKTAKKSLVAAGVALGATSALIMGMGSGHAEVSAEGAQARYSQYTRHLQQLDDAAAEAAASRQANSCTAVETCERPQVFIDGKAASDSYIVAHARGLFLGRYGQDASVATFSAAVTSPSSDVSRNALLAAAWNGLLQLDAESLLTDAQRSELATRMAGLDAAHASGEVTSRVAGTSSPVTPQDATGKRVFTQAIAVQILAQSLSEKPDPKAAALALLGECLNRHSLAFTAQAGVSLDDLRAFVQNGPTWH